jgi:DNA primase
MLAKFYNEEISEEGIYDAQEKKKKIVYEKNRKTAIKYRLSHTTESFSYLIDRGLTISDINLFNIGYNPESNRITFPIQDKYSNIIGFTNRELSKTDVSGRKYINSRNSDIFIKKASFYGINLLDYEHDYIYITEGVFDVILAKKYGIKNVVCTLGCHLSEEHVKIIKALGKTPVLCYDGDDAGQKGARSAYELLSSNGVENVQILPLPFNMDLADTANKMKAELKDFVLNNTKSYAKYKIDEITNKLDNIILAAMNEANSNITSLLKNIQSENESIIYKNYANKRLHLWK